jgi:toxin-antitoxin system PIN domain toxin
VIAVDTNVLIYAHRAESQWFTAAAGAIERLASRLDPWAIPWPCIHEFLAVVTNPRVFKPPTPLRVALKQVEIWRESPSLRMIGEMQEHWHELSAILSAGKIVGGAVHDARIAAMCREHGVRELWSMDRDFSRIAGIKCVNPLL